LAERETKITPYHISHVQKELFEYGSVGTKQLRVLLINRLNPGRIAHPLGQPGDDSRHRITRHQARQDEVQDECSYQGDQEPKQLVKEIISVPFQRSTSS
jgi:hypothetical protein